MGQRRAARSENLCAGSCGGWFLSVQPLYPLLTAATLRELGGRDLEAGLTSGQRAAVGDRGGRVGCGCGRRRRDDGAGDGGVSAEPDLSRIQAVQCGVLGIDVADPHPTDHTVVAVARGERGSVLTPVGRGAGGEVRVRTAGVVTDTAAVLGGLAGVDDERRFGDGAGHDSLGFRLGNRDIALGIQANGLRAGVADEGFAGAV